MKRVIFSAIMLMLASAAFAEVRLPAVLGSNMVLQRNSEVNFWGTAEPDSKVRIVTSWDGKKYTVKADSEGRWRTRLSTGEAGGPYSITVSDGEKLILDNILLGEVWVCGGQSNMAFPVRGDNQQSTDGGAQAITDAMLYPGIRLFTVPRHPSDTPKYDCDGRWQTSSPASVADFSAVAYFFGRTLNKVLGIPVGLISSNVGSSAIEAWMTVEAIDATPGINHELSKSGKSKYSKAQNFWNSMILPIKDFTAKGFIWYQGCSNKHNWFDYKELQKSMIRLWRSAWGNDEMPFYITQLTPYIHEGNDKRSSSMVIEAQYQAASEMEHVGVAATTDVGSPCWIHPAKKFEVGQRLAWLALGNDYGVEGLPLPAPTYKSMERDGNKLVLSFNNVDNGGNSLGRYYSDTELHYGGFEIAGEDRVFQPARVNLKWMENKIEVWSEWVAEPVAVRYAFRNIPQGANVRTTLGQPLAPFRTDDWPVEDTGLEK